MDCKCYTPPFNAQDYSILNFGIDKVNNRYGEVTIETCNHCDTIWIKYFVEYEHYSKSGRWYKAIINNTTLQQLVIGKVVDYFEKAPWYFYGGSYFNSTILKGKGKLKLD